MTTPGDAPDQEGAPEPTSEESPARGVEQIEAEIEQTREQLGETVAALTAKLDVKTRAKHQVDAAREWVRVRAHTARVRAAEVAVRMQDTATDERGLLEPVVAAAGGALVGFVVGAVVVGGCRRR